MTELLAVFSEGVAVVGAVEVAIAYGLRYVMTQHRGIYCL